METALRTVNALISALFFICYAYQFLYIPLVLAKKQRPLPCPPSPHRYAVLIAARNEAAVIGGLLDSLRQQTTAPTAPPISHGAAALWCMSGSTTSTWARATPWTF